MKPSSRAHSLSVRKVAVAMSARPSNYGVPGCAAYLSSAGSARRRHIALSRVDGNQSVQVVVDKLLANLYI